MRRPVGILVAAFLIAFLAPMALPAPGAEAASCGTNWRSIKTPPDTIRVLLTSQGRVVVEPFRSYVAMVMASGEFPTWLPSPVLEAGATAVKQYAWYYALKGHHRPDYRTPSGDCYDVRNDTNDQLFTTAASPTKKQLRALDATWGLTLRKGKRFFLTGYRAGTASRCASDADGWRLYAKSMVDCANKGWTRQQIQERYYAPRITFVWRTAPPPPNADTTPPSVTVPQAVPAAAQGTSGRVSVAITWSASDASGVGAYQVQERVQGGPWRSLALSSSTATSVQVDTTPGLRHRFRVKARDKAGNSSGWVSGVAFVPQITQSDGARLQGTWASRSDRGASGGTSSITTQTGARASLQFRGSAVAVMARTGPHMGRARVTVDGVVVAVIDLRSSLVVHRRVVYARSWAGGGDHTITLEALGTGGHPRINVDAFILLR